MIVQMIKLPIFGQSSPFDGTFLKYGIYNIAAKIDKVSDYIP